ncbi:hypothetical protein FVEG_02738 [Fusarium verticillioides 7600]|uniref:Uncharacterized protein n=1 Tax=Gibberella moniliformis (strain M3125 / FGSC 7600) TaxID=334819 RepID=W7M5S7_GIBM7|nr:hypothetical protein FVEG_02738 [Fusarium verticillioides 7600]EWG40282.1 hypothetical protein FVEG_02738 [Fusarium verticillioides 7600]
MPGKVQPTQQGHIRDCDFLIAQSVLAAQNIAVNRQSSNLARPDHLSYRGSKDPESLARLNLRFYFPRLQPTSIPSGLHPEVRAK